MKCECCFNKNFGTGGVFEKLLPKEDYFSQALYTFDIGQNDITAGYKKKHLTSEQIKAYVPDVMGQFSDIIKVLQIHNNHFKKKFFLFKCENGLQVTCRKYMVKLEEYILGTQRRPIGLPSIFFGPISYYRGPNG